MDAPRTKRILVVDDEADLTHFLTLLLARRTGHEVQQASNGDRALEMLRSGTFHLVVSDIHMPGMNGLELLRQIKALNPDIEVVMLTGQGALESAVDALQMQAYDYIEKPVNADRLVQAVKNALAQQALSAELSRTIQQVAQLNRDLKRQVRETLGSLVPRERIATAGAILDHLEKAMGRELAQSGPFIKLRAALERQRSAPASVDVAALVRTQVAEVLGVFPWIEPVLELPDEPLHTSADAGALAQALRIFLENAVQALKERGIVHVGARAADGEIWIRVRDEGPGFTADALALVDEPFLGSSCSGTGMGLLVARRIAEDHAGSLELTNSPSGGAQITLRIPLR